MKTFLNTCALIAAALIVALATACENSDSADDGGQTEAPASPFVAFCSNIDYSDTTVLHNGEKMEKMTRVMVKMLPSTDSVATREGFAIFFNGLRHDEAALSSAMNHLDKHLNYPASPLRNERVYICALSTLLGIDSIPPSARSIASERLRIVSLNRPGTLANDFQFEEPDGSRRSLYGIEAPMTLLVFYNPECSPCTKILDEIAANQAVNEAISQGWLAVVAIYAEGDRSVWRGSVAEMPKNWTVGYDLSAILDNDIYDLPAMPTLYVLDADKRVLLKDPDHRIVSRYLRKKMAAR